MYQRGVSRGHALRYIVRCGCQWRMIPHDLPPWQVVYQQAQRWMKAGSFEVMAHDLRELARLARGRNAQPTAVVMDGRTLQSSPASGVRAGHDGYKRRKGSKVHIAVDTLGHLLTLQVTAANEQERAQVSEFAEQIQQATGEKVGLAVSIKVTQEQSLHGERNNTASSWRSSSFRKPKRALCCCHAAGWSNAASAGRLGSAAWPAITSGCPKPWPDCTIWPSPVSCCPI